MNPVVLHPRETRHGGYHPYSLLRVLKQNVSKKRIGNHLVLPRPDGQPVVCDGQKGAVYAGMVRIEEMSQAEST